MIGSNPRPELSWAPVAEVSQAPADSTRHQWEQIYTKKAETEVSWYQAHSVRSLEMIVSAASSLGVSIIDVGGGASTLVDDLIARGYSDLTVLDIADTGLAKAKVRLGSNAAKVSWVAADITLWQPPHPYDIWHDRAVFHFLTEVAQQDAYIHTLRSATRPGSTVIMATFALEGPEKCSGLPVQRYSSVTLAKRLGRSFSLAATATEVHKTPGGFEQPFAYSMFRRTAI